ncbi:MAG: KamA family radical SAM protein [Deltaproteobacteria bacterium]|nr:KamA family radical SAM protein [Deltaproteobacteria bacterium]
MNSPLYREKFFPHSHEQWGDWHWQLRNSIYSPSQLGECLSLFGGNASDLNPVVDTYHMFVTPYYISLIESWDSKDPIALQCLPQVREIDPLAGGYEDPLGEERDTVVPGLIHRYSDRCLAMITSRCATYCRHCNRKRRWGGAIGAKDASPASLAAMVKYVANTPAVREVILSGGDPLVINEDLLEYILASLTGIKHVEVVRIGSRIPVVLPMRITPGLCRMLKKYRPLWFNTQFNHPREITEESARACEMLLEAGIPLSNQSVLLKGVNDTPETMRNLLQGLQKISVRPYYLFQCEPVKGATHFQTEISVGRGIMEKLWGHVSGLCIPRYVIDIPGGAGKLSLEASSCHAGDEAGKSMRELN